VALDYEISAVRLIPSDDQSHFHVELVGYLSLHTPDEPITIDIPRVLQKMAFDEKFHITWNGEPAEVTAGKCPVCGFEPHLKTSADPPDRTVLLDLPQE
jgi:hypothetical protein